MATKNYKRQNLVAGSAMVQGTEDIIDRALEPQQAQEQQPQLSAQVFAQQQDGDKMVNVQTRVPNSWYKKLRDMKYDHPEFGDSIGSIVQQAIKEFIQNHPIG